jgi:hypothetical protein
MATYANDRLWSDLMIDEIRSIVGPRLLIPAPLEMDANQATDLFVFTARDMRIAARVRRPGYADRYPFEFTIRSKRDSGAETEMSKIVSGWGDWMFYGHATEENRIGLWWLIDLHVFRRSLILHKRDGVTRIRSAQQSNQDGTHFMAYDLRSFPQHPPILIASSRNLFEAAA